MRRLIGSKEARYPIVYQDEGDYTSQFDYDNAKDYWFDELGKFIDNSFDIRELTMIANCIRVACFNEEVANSIMDKLIKQKEMWCKDER